MPKQFHVKCKDTYNDTRRIDIICKSHKEVIDVVNTFFGLKLLTQEGDLCYCDKGFKKINIVIYNE